jgi:hypothetical protein
MEGLVWMRDGEAVENFTAVHTHSGQLWTCAIGGVERDGQASL